MGCAGGSRGRAGGSKECRDVAESAAWLGFVIGVSSRSARRGVNEQGQASATIGLATSEACNASGRKPIS